MKHFRKQTSVQCSGDERRCVIEQSGARGALLQLPEPRFGDDFKQITSVWTDHGEELIHLWPQAACHRSAQWSRSTVTNNLLFFWSLGFNCLKYFDQWVDNKDIL